MLWTPQLNWHDVFVNGFGPKVLEKPVICPVTLNTLYLYTRTEDFDAK